MVREINCECTERVGIEIDSFSLFEDIKFFFQEKANKGLFEDLSDYSRIWHKHGGTETKILRDTIKYYKCKACGCLWEFRYPEFPASGRVRKFPEGIYYEE